MNKRPPCEICNGSGEVRCSICCGDYLDNGECCGFPNPGLKPCDQCNGTGKQQEPSIPESFA